MWLVILAESHPIASLLVAALVVVGDVLGVVSLIIMNWCRIVGSLVVAFQPDDKRRADGLDLARIEQTDRRPSRLRLPPRRRKDDENAGQGLRPPPA